MAEVHVTINGRSYPVACEAGEEARVKELAQYLDRKAVEFARRFGPIGEARLLVLAALTVADELADSRAAARRSPEPASGGNGFDSDALAEGLEELAQRIETIAQRLESPQSHR